MTELEREKGNSCGKGEGNETKVRRWWREGRGESEEGEREREDGTSGERAGRREKGGA